MDLSPSLPVPRLTIRCGSPLVSPGQVECQEARSIRLGRHSDNDMVFQDDQVSRRHAEIYSRGSQWVVLNLSATNPVLVDGVPLAAELILSGSQNLVLGNTSVTVEVAAQPGESSRRKSAELAGLVDYLSLLETAPSPEVMVEATLALLHRHCQAAWTGFVGNEAEELRLRAQFPEDMAAAAFLSRELNRRALTELAPIWQASASAPGGMSDSLGRVNDSLGIPLIDRRGGESRVLGVIHLYRRQGRFMERETHFAQIVARMAALWLGASRQMSALSAAVRRLGDRSGASGRLIGENPAMVDLRQRIAKLAASPMSVLIRGESGTGKELVAEAIHKASQRASAPLVAVNCASIDHSRAESDLFGHEKGAFTGADSRHAGYFQQAHEGTLFLDEIGELPLECQAKLLRALETGLIRPMKGKERAVDVRLVVATNRDLLAEVAAGRFREDLYYRVAAVVVEVPSLRARKDDIPLLTRHFLDRLSVAHQRPANLSTGALRALEQFPWPGNVRQLRSVVEAAFHMAGGDEIGTAHLSLPRVADDGREEHDLNLEQAEKRLMAKAIGHTAGNLTKAAELLGIHRETLGIRARKHGLLPPS